MLSGVNLAISNTGSIGGTLSCSGISNSGSLIQTSSSTFSGPVSVTGTSFSCAGATSVNLGTNLISLSGAGITTNTIPSSSVVGGAVTLTTSQTKTSGTLTFATGSSLTMNSGSSLTINGTFTVGSGITGSCSQAQVSDSSSSSTTCYFPFFELGSYSLTASPTSLQMYSDSNLSYVPSTKTLTSSSFSSQQINIGGFSKTSNIGLLVTDVTNFGGVLNFYSSPFLPGSSTATSFQQLGYQVSNTVTVSGTGYTNYQFAGPSGLVLNSSTQFGVYAVQYNYCFSGLTSSNYFDISIGSSAVNTLNNSCRTSLTNAMSGFSSTAAGQLTYYLNWYSTSTTCYITIHSNATFTTVNSSYCVVRIG